MIEKQLDDLAAMHGLAREDALEQIYLSAIPQRRLIEAREIATMARYLASDEARSITGQAINVSAGLIMH